MIVTSDEKVVNYILKDNFDNYIKGEKLYDAMSGVLGDGIFNVDGFKKKKKSVSNLNFLIKFFSKSQHWHEQRKAISHLFKKRLMRTILTKLKNLSLSFLDVLERYEGKEVDIQRFTLSYSFQSFFFFKFLF